MATIGNIMPNMSGIGNVILFGGIAVVIGLILGGLLFLFIVKSRQIKVYEINMVTKEIKVIMAIPKKNKSHIKQLYIGGRIKKFLPNVQQQDMYRSGGKETVILFKDNNGLHSTARTPTLEQYLDWCAAQGLNLSAEVERIKNADTMEVRQNIIEKLKDTAQGVVRKKELDVITTTYLLPNPLESIEWLANEQNQAISMFGAGFLKHPALVFIGTIFVCGLVFIMTLVVGKLM